MQLPVNSHINSGIPQADPSFSTDTLISMSVCDICGMSGPELCCTSCDADGLPYHERCWYEERHHRRPCNPPHLQTPIGFVKRLSFFNEPNKQTSIEDQTFLDDDANCFVEWDARSQMFQFGPRANRLLRREYVHGPTQTQYPSFVSFVGRTMSGKSYLLRTLQHGGPADKFPTPIPAPGAQQHNHSSTSSDIHLYADWKTAETESPILFLDCEGYDGSDTPSSYTAKAKKMALNVASMLTVRRECVEDAYPRFIYAFSTCVVFITSGPLAESASIGRRLLSYASQGAGGSPNQGFKPSLFVIFNRFMDGNCPDFDWTISSSTEAFLTHGDLKDLNLFYGSIHVIYIPTVHKDESAIALSQIDQFQKLLREEHEKAFRCRQKFSLVFTPDQLGYFLWKALELFSESRSAVFDWSIETGNQGFGSSDLLATYKDLWMQLTKYYATRTKTSQDLYKFTRTTFVKHVVFCLLLSLTRRPPYRQRASIPRSLEFLIRHIDQLLTDYAPCAAMSPAWNTECRETKHRHGDHHQGIRPILIFRKADRWSGFYEADKTTDFRTVQQELEAALKKPRQANVSLHLSGSELLPPDICSLTSCFGCLQSPPNMALACGHAFCVHCIHELARDDPLPHRIPDIYCPFHSSRQEFSPRLLPIQAGYRILSLDGGGAKGFAQLIILRHIEKLCFQIPTTYLYDLIVGTSVGGLIALALTAPTLSNHPASSSPLTPGTPLTPPTPLVLSIPLTVAATIQKFKELAMTGFVDNDFGTSISGWFSSKTAYQISRVERQLQGLFGKKPLLFSATSNSIPNVAVTTVPQDSFQAHLVANYNRKAAPGAYPLLLRSDSKESMPIWAAARCTSAAVPHIDGFPWQGQRLLDGGFELNCPAAAALSEAKGLWPEKQCDSLVSVGTGIFTTREHPSLHDILRLPGETVEVDVSSEMIWKEFRSRRDPGVFRLNPVYPGTGFTLNDFGKLDEIERQTEEWLETQEKHIAAICDQLIAVLFFFCQKVPIKNGVIGEILCRLPVNLESRQNLIGQMFHESDLNIFRVELGSDRSEMINIALGDLKSIRAGCELRIPVTLHNLRDIDGTVIQIKMRNLGQNAPTGSSAHRWYPISGSPCILRLKDGTDFSSPP